MGPRRSGRAALPLAGTRHQVLFRPYQGRYLGRTAATRTITVFVRPGENELVLRVLDGR